MLMGLIIAPYRTVSFNAEEDERFVIVAVGCNLDSATRHVRSILEC
jgi:hypothetical protein